MTLVLLPGQSLQQGVGIVGAAIPQEAGVSFSVTVAAVDTDYQVAYVGTGTIALTTGDPQDVEPPSQSLVNGVATFVIDPRAMGTWQIEITGGPGPNNGAMYVVSRVIRASAGSGTSGFGGDNGPAEAARLTVPFAMTGRPDGSVYIADTGNGRIRRVTSGGIISTVAGGGPGCAQQTNSVGDNCPATQARLNAPADVAFDSAGHMYIADQQNHRVRRVDAVTGIMSTFAGTGIAGFAGDGGPAASARFALPTSIEFDATGNLYVTDENNQRVRRITLGGIISTYAGNGTVGSTGDGGPATAASLNLPTGLAIDAAGNVYIAEQGGHRVRKVLGGSTIVTIAGTGVFGFTGDGGFAEEEGLSSPFGLAIDSAQNLYVADTGSNRIRRIDADTGRIGTIVGTGASGSAGDGQLAALATVDQPLGVEVDSGGNIYIADTFSHRVRRIGGGGLAPTPTATATSTITTTPTATATAMVDPDGDLFPTDLELLYGTNPNDPDTDGDGFLDLPDDSFSGPNVDPAHDNCPLVDNPLQTNTDATPLDNGPDVGGDDVTILNGDVSGDDCDLDDDNDGMLDVNEGVFPVPGCPQATAMVLPQVMDTDGDRLADGWECVNGSNPVNPTSRFLGTGATDADNDRVIDIWELRGYGGSAASPDTDGDGCDDLLELVSVDGNRALTDVDRITVARRALGILAPEPSQDYVLDLNKNGAVDDADRVFAARAVLLFPSPPCT
jgi:sugar lactone lactonase YvrE